MRGVVPRSWQKIMFSSWEKILSGTHWKHSPQPALDRVLAGTFPAPSSHDRSLATLTVRDISGWRTRTVSFVAGPNVASANPHRRNSPSASTAASYSVDEVISTIHLTSS